MKNKFLHFVVTAVTLLSIPVLNFAQAPNLGTAANFVLFSTNGAVTNSGTSHLTGNVGTNTGPTTGFGNVNGVMHTGDGTTATCAADLLNAYNQLNVAIPTFFPAPLLGNGDTLVAGVYSISGTASLNLNLILDAKNNPNAVFIFQIQGAFSTSAASQVILINGAVACNVFWKVEGLVSIASATSMKGTVIANNAAINMSTGAVLEGRALSTTGAVTVNGITANTPVGCGSPLLTGPIAPALGSTACYALFSGNGEVTNGGVTFITGDIGTNVGLTTGYDPLNVKGIIHPIPDVSTAACAADLLNVYSYLNTLPQDIELLYPAQFGNGLVLTPHTYLLNAATSFTDTLFLDAQGNKDAVFVIKISGALTTSVYATVIMMNGARAKNVYWKIDGALKISSNSNIKGTIVVNNGAINLGTGTKLEGRALTTDGALTTAAVTANITAGCSTLPLSLLSFSVHMQNNDAVLNWKTTGEQNTVQFEVEQSMDAKNYAKIGTVAAAGSSSMELSYSFNQMNIAAQGSSVAYYRLKMTDADGMFTYSHVVALQIKGKGVVLMFYPNPVKEKAILMISVVKSELVNYTIADNTGKILHTEKVTLVAGSNTLNIDVKALASGVYNLFIQGAQTKERVRFVKQ